MQNDLIVAVGTSSEQATALAIANGCVGFYTGVPPKWMDLSIAQGWTLPCVVTTDDTGAITSWSPVVAP